MEQVAFYLQCLKKQMVWNAGLSERQRWLVKGPMWDASVQCAEARQRYFLSVGCLEVENKQENSASTQYLTQR